MVPPNPQKLAIVSTVASSFFMENKNPLAVRPGETKLEYWLDSLSHLHKIVFGTYIEFYKSVILIEFDKLRIIFAFKKNYPSTDHMLTFLNDAHANVHQVISTQRIACLIKAIFSKLCYKIGRSNVNFTTAVVCGEL